MKPYIRFSLVILVMLSWVRMDAKEHYNSADLEESLLDSLIEQTNLDTLIHTVNILSGEDSVTLNDSTFLFESRHPVHPHNDLAADYIYQTLTRYGLEMVNHQYSATGRNVYGIQNGSVYPDQFFIICAHYDDMPIVPPAPGADDNASGVAAVLEAARLLATIEIPYSIIYAFWDEEEIGPLFGSARFAEQARDSVGNIMGVINLDMIGWNGNKDRQFRIYTSSVDNSVILAETITDLVARHELDLSPVIDNPGSSRSDHASFWQEGYSAIGIGEGFEEGDLNPHWHTYDDRIEHFDMDYFYLLSKLAVATIAHLSIEGLPVEVAIKDIVGIADFELLQNYPNPFNPTTTIQFQLSRSSDVTLTIYSLLGEEIQTLISGELPAGEHQVEWNGGDLASGVYFYRLEVSDPSSGFPLNNTGKAGQRFVQTRKMAVVK